MADLIIKPSAVADEFKMNDANSSANTILTIEGQTDSTVTTAGRIIYGKGVNETLGTTSYDATPNTQTIDLATGTFFNVEMGALIDDWKILHLPAANTIAAWVVRLKNHSTPEPDKVLVVPSLVILTLVVPSVIFPNTLVPARVTSPVRT